MVVEREDAVVGRVVVRGKEKQTGGKKDGKRQCMKGGVSGA